MIDRILPLLNKFVPLGLAVKGLERISPKIKSFLGGATAAGYSANEAMDFLRNQFSGPQMQEPVKGSRPDEKAAFNRRQHEETPQRVAQGVASIGAGALGGLGAAAVTGAGQVAEELSPGANQDETSQASQQPSGFLEFIKQNPELGSYLDSLIQKGMNPIQAASEAKKHRKFGPLVQSIEGQMGQSFEDLLSQLFQGSQQNGQNTTQNSRPAGQNTSQSGGDSELIAALQQILKM